MRRLPPTASMSTTMAKRAVGYSGTSDNPFATVVMDHTGRRVNLAADKGTDGQTLDLLINRDNTVYLMNNSVNSIFKDVVQKLPAEKLSRFRMIVDGGSHFRGVDPFAVAKKMANWGQRLKVPYQVVLSYDVETRLPFAVRAMTFTSKSRLLHSGSTSLPRVRGYRGCDAVFLPQFNHRHRSGD